MDHKSILIEQGAAGIHFPISCSVPALWRGWAKKDARAPKRSLDIMQVQRDCSTGGGHWRTLLSSIQEVAGHLPLVSAVEMNTQVLATCMQLYPRSPDVKGTLHHVDPSLSGMRDRQWLIRREIHKPAGAGLHAVFKRWWLVIRLSCLSRASAKRSKQLRKQKMQAIFQHAMEASSRNDMATFYRTIRRLAPKKSRTRMALRDTKGALLGAHAEGRCLHEYLSNMFVASGVPSLKLSVLSFLPVGREEVEYSVSQLPSRKSVPRHCVPSCVGKTSSQTISEWLMHILDGFRGSIPDIPVCWRKSWVVFVPKPGKNGHRPEHWRPICLQDALGKAVLKAITTDARNQVLPWLVEWPQYAYLPGRGTYDAICRVIGHCEVVRCLAKSSVNTIHDTRAGTDRVLCAGGLQILVDLSGAFDRAPRSLLQAALEDLPLSRSEGTLPYICFYTKSFKGIQLLCKRCLPSLHIFLKVSRGTCCCLKDLFFGYILCLKISFLKNDGTSCSNSFVC